jgi:hypothetical protein
LGCPRERDAICGAGGKDTAIDGGDITLAEEHIIADVAAATGCRPKGIRPVGAGDMGNWFNDDVGDVAAAEDLVTRAASNRRALSHSAAVRSLRVLPYSLGQG